MDIEPEQIWLCPRCGQGYAYNLAAMMTGGQMWEDSKHCKPCQTRCTLVTLNLGEVLLIREEPDN
jgi:hypothetical protein